MNTGYLNPTELTNLKIMADSAMINSNMLNDLIQRDLMSPLKRRMNEGVNYYNCKHDILDHINYYYVDSVKTEDKVKANNRIPHPFHKILVDQKTAYIVGKPVVVSVKPPEVEDEKNPTPEEQSLLEDAKEFQECLTEKLGKRFNKVLHDWVKGASNKSQEYVHFYITPVNPVTKKAELKYIICPAQQIIPIYDTQYEEELIAVIRYYTYDLIDAKGHMEQRYKLEYWDKNEVKYWAQNINNVFVHDPDYTVNPAPHWFSWNTQTPDEKINHAWGRVPFIPLWNNSELKTDLEAIKSLMDAYDSVKSGWMNDLEDFQELIYVLKDYQGVSEEARKGYSELGYFVHNLKTHKAIAVDGSGDVTTLKAEIPVEAKEKFLQITRKEIFYFGEGIDVDNEKFGNSPSGVSLKFLYASLDLKADRIQTNLEIVLEDFVWFVTEYINNSENKSYDYSEVQFTFNRAVIFNEKEKIDELVASGLKPLDQKTLLENHPLVDNVEMVLARLEAEKAAEIESGMVNLGKIDVNQDPNVDPNNKTINQNVSD